MILSMLPALGADALVVVHNLLDARVAVRLDGPANSRDVALDLALAVDHSVVRVEPRSCAGQSVSFGSLRRRVPRLGSFAAQLFPIALPDAWENLTIASYNQSLHRAAETPLAEAAVIMTSLTVTRAWRRWVLTLRIIIGRLQLRLQTRSSKCLQTIRHVAFCQCTCTVSFDDSQSSDLAGSLAVGLPRLWTLGKNEETDKDGRETVAEDKPEAGA